MSLTEYRLRWVARIRAWDAELCVPGPSPVLEFALEDLRTAPDFETAHHAVLWWRDAYEAARVDPSPETWREMAEGRIEPPELVARAKKRSGAHD